MKYLGIFGLVVAGLLCIGMDTNYELSTKHHVVREGQTVWGIATKYKGEQDMRMTMDEFVYNISKANNLQGQKFLHPGQVLVIPLYKAEKK